MFNTIYTRKESVNTFLFFDCFLMGRMGLMKLIFKGFDYKILKTYYNWHIVLTNDLGDRGSFPGLVIPKTQKMVLYASLLNIQHYKVQIKGK